MAVKNEEWPWQILQFCPWHKKTAGENFWLVPEKNKKCSSQTSGSLSENSHHLKLPFFFLEKTHRNLFKTRTIVFFNPKMGKDNFFSVHQEMFIRHSLKVWWGFNYFIKNYAFFLISVFFYIIAGKVHMSLIHLNSESFFSHR